MLFARALIVTVLTLAAAPAFTKPQRYNFTGCTASANLLHKSGNQNMTFVAQAEFEIEGERANLKTDFESPYQVAYVGTAALPESFALDVRIDLSDSYFDVWAGASKKDGEKSTTIVTAAARSRIPLEVERKGLPGGVSLIAENPVVQNYTRTHPEQSPFGSPDFPENTWVLENFSITCTSLATGL